MICGEIAKPKIMENFSLYQDTNSFRYYLKAYMILFSGLFVAVISLLIYDYLKQQNNTNNTDQPEEKKENKVLKALIAVFFIIIIISLCLFSLNNKIAVKYKEVPQIKEASNIHPSFFQILDSINQATSSQHLTVTPEQLLGFSPWFDRGDSWIVNDVMINKNNYGISFKGQTIDFFSLTSETLELWKVFNYLPENCSLYYNKNAVVIQTPTTIVVIKKGNIDSVFLYKNYIWFRWRTSKPYKLFVQLSLVKILTQANRTD